MHPLPSRCTPTPGTAHRDCSFVFNKEAGDWADVKNQAKEAQ